MSICPVLVPARDPLLGSCRQCRWASWQAGTFRAAPSRLPLHACLIPQQHLGAARGRGITGLDSQCSSVIALLAALICCACASLLPVQRDTPARPTSPTTPLAPEDAQGSVDPGGSQHT